LFQVLNRYGCIVTVNVSKVIPIYPILILRLTNNWPIIIG
jgi:hypothetical protein